MSDLPLKELLVKTAHGNLAPLLGHRDHAVSGRWHSHGLPRHLILGPIETPRGAPHSKDIAEELAPLMEDYWLVDEGS
jgi:hypothetical protein